MERERKKQILTFHLHHALVVTESRPTNPDNAHTLAARVPCAVRGETRGEYYYMPIERARMLYNALLVAAGGVCHPNG